MVRNRNQNQLLQVYPRDQSWDLSCSSSILMICLMRSVPRCVCLPMIQSLEIEDDGSALQNDLDILSKWETRWDMEFNPSKCQAVHVTGSKIPIKKTMYCTGRYWSLCLVQNILGLIYPAPSPGIPTSIGLSVAQIVH